MKRGTIQEDTSKTDNVSLEVWNLFSVRRELVLGLWVNKNIGKFIIVEGVIICVTVNKIGLIRYVQGSLCKAGVYKNMSWHTNKVTARFEFVIRAINSLQKRKVWPPGLIM